MSTEQEISRIKFTIEKIQDTTGDERYARTEEIYRQTVYLSSSKQIQDVILIINGVGEVVIKEKKE